MPIEIQAGNNSAIYRITGWRNAWKVLFGGLRLRVVVEGLGPNPTITAGPDSIIKDIYGHVVQNPRPGFTVDINR